MIDEENPSFSEIRKLNRVNKKEKNDKGLCKKSGTMEVETPADDNEKLIFID